MKKQKEIYGQRLFKGLLLAVSVAVLAGCANITSRQMADDEEEVVTGPSSRRNYTVMDPAFACLANGMRANNRPVIGVAVGDVKDYTGKYGQNEGNTITQGGALMATMLPTGEHISTPSLPLEFDGLKVGKRADPPKVGEHTVAILKDLGLDDEAIALLRHHGKIGV